MTIDIIYYYNCDNNNYTYRELYSFGILTGNRNLFLENHLIKSAFDEAYKKENENISNSTFWFQYGNKRFYNSPFLKCIFEMQ